MPTARCCSLSMQYSVCSWCPFTTFISGVSKKVLPLFGPLRERWSLQCREAVIFCWLAVGEKWHTSSLRLVFTSLVKDEKKKKMGKCFMSPVFSCQKQKRRAKESWDRYSDIPRKDMAGMKACHFVRDDHETAPLFFFSFFFSPPFFETDFVRIWRIYCFCFALPLENRNGTLKIGCLQASQMCPFDISDKKLKNETERSAISFDRVFIGVLAQRGITNWSFHKFRSLILMKCQQPAAMYWHINASIYIFIFMYTRSAVSTFCAYFRP